MRSALTVILLLALLGGILLYRLGTDRQSDGFYGNQVSGIGRGGSDYGFWSWLYPFADIVEEANPVEKPIEDTPCSTDFDCKTGHCGMFGMCTNGLSL
jgi:hypothetical protein